MPPHQLQRTLVVSELGRRKVKIQLQMMRPSSVLHRLLALPRQQLLAEKKK
jgi:hypothetical protein